MTRESGTCVRWEFTWGWISPDAVGARDLFVHFTFLEMDGRRRELSQGQRVSFERGLDRGRECATAVRLLKEES